MRCASDPAITVRDIGHDPASTRDVNAARVLAALPGTARAIAAATDLGFLAVADAILLLVSRKQAVATGPFTYAKA